MNPQPFKTAETPRHKGLQGLCVMHEMCMIKSERVGEGVLRAQRFERLSILLMYLKLVYRTTFERIYLIQIIKFEIIYIKIVFGDYFIFRALEIMVIEI